jgi:uncharacterized membrane protein (UPF0127 family)
MNRPALSIAALLSAGAMALAACADADPGPSSTVPPAGVATTSLPAPTEPATAATTTSTPPAPTTQAPTTTLPEIPGDIAVPEQLVGLPLAVIAVDGEPLIVAIAARSAARQQGLMSVTDLAGLDGMLFVWQSDTGGSFWMRDTLLPLDIAFFAVDGTLVNAFPMEPCDQGANCPLYESGGRYRYALETTQGRLPDLAAGSVLTVPEGFAGNE